MTVDIQFPTFALVSVYDKPPDAVQLQYDWDPRHQYYYRFASDQEILAVLDVYSLKPSYRVRRAMMNRAGGQVFADYKTLLWAHREAFNFMWMDWFGYYPDICMPGDIKSRMLDSLSVSSVPKYLWRWYMEMIIARYIDGPGPWEDERRESRVRDALC